jgi:hypothetical protein
MYSSAFCSVVLQAYNLKSPNLSLVEVYPLLTFVLMKMLKQFLEQSWKTFLTIG